MSLDNNYSTINKQQKIISIDDSNYGTSRIIVNIPNLNYDIGITGGDVIRYDTVGQIYIKSNSNTSANAEVFGIVESVLPDLSLNVVINGSITYPLEKLINRSGTNTGLNDVYFLSSQTGLIENAGPTFPNYVIKPVYYNSPHGEYTGIVRNYLGYSNNIITQTDTPPDAPDAFLVRSFSDNVTKVLLYNGFTKEFSLRVSTFSIPNLRFNTTEYLKVNIESIEIPPGEDRVNFGIGPNYDAKISNNGDHILLFAKHLNKIYYIINDPNTENLRLIQTINLMLSGSPEDKLWATDDELSCMTVSTRSLTREPSPFDTKINSHEICSKIQYFKRNVNSTQATHNRWRKIHENHAFGYCDAKPRELDGTCVDSLSVTPGIYRTNDLKCKGKNFGLSTICLINDQINYSSKITGYHSSRYNGINKSASLVYLTNVAGITNDIITYSTPSSFTTKFFGSFAFSQQTLQNNPSRDSPSYRSYKCGFGFKNFRILTKSGSYYYEDFSYRDPSGIEYFSAAENSASFTSYPAYARINTNSSDAHSILEAPGTSVEASITKVTPTADSIFCCFRYGTEVSVFKFPFLSHDGLSPFRYFDKNMTSASTVPNTAGYGLVYQNTSSPVVNFNFFATDSVFFICTSTKTFINGTVEVSTVNFDKAEFFYTATNQFFKVDEKIYRFNSSTNSFQETTIGLS